MILALIAYSILAAGLAGLTAHGAEATLRAARRPGRVPWMVAILVAVVAPFVVPFIPEEGPLAVPVGFRDAGSIVVSPAEGLGGLASLDPFVAALWVLASAGLLGAVGVAGWRLQRWRATWRATRLQGTPVLVSGHIGPAVVGLWDGQIVLPEWALREESRTLGLLLEHERQHLAARDHRLLGVGIAALVLMPWNLALWWIVSRLRLAAEIDCDARVLAGTRSDVVSYGSLLIAVGQRLASAPAVGVAFSRPASNLEHRIRALASEGSSQRVGRGIGWLGLTAVSFGLLCLAPHPVIEVCRELVPPTAPTSLVLGVVPHAPTVIEVLDLPN
jgi:hypothetical protein